MAKNTRGLSANRIKTDPAFERTRENMAEFKRAGKAAKLLRTIFREVTIIAKDKITHGRLVQVMLSAILKDPVNERGERTVNNGDLTKLRGFQFNERAGITSSLFVNCSINFNRVSGEATVNIPAFVPSNMVAQLPGTTHFRIVAAAAINFDTEEYVYTMQGTPELRYNNEPTQAATLTLALPANSTDMIIAVLGIEYYQQVKNRNLPLKSTRRNASSICW